MHDLGCFWGPTPPHGPRGGRLLSDAEYAFSCADLLRILPYPLRVERTQAVAPSEESAVGDRRIRGVVEGGQVFVSASAEVIARWSLLHHTHVL